MRLVCRSYVLRTYRSRTVSVDGGGGFAFSLASGSWGVGRRGGGWGGCTALILEYVRSEDMVGGSECCSGDSARARKAETTARFRIHCSLLILNRTARASTPSHPPSSPPPLRQQQRALLSRSNPPIPPQHARGASPLHR